MKSRSSWMASLLSGPLSLSLLVLSSAHGQTMTWDSNADTAPNPNDGAGTWSIVGNPTTSANWWNGTTNVVWNNTDHANTIAVFGTNSNAGLAGAINLGANTIDAGGLRFDEIKLPVAAQTTPVVIAAGTEEAYSFTNGTINLANNALIDVRSNSSTSNTTAGRLRFGATSRIAGENVTITNANGGNTSFGIMQFAGSNTWSGIVTFTGNANGGLFAEATNAAALNTASKIVVNNGATLALNYGSGTNNKAFELSGTGSASRGALRFDQTLTLGGTVKLNGDTRIGTNTAATIIGTLGGDISGDYNLSVASNVIATGTVVFKGNNTYKNLTINRGNAQIGEGGVGTSGTGTVTLNLTAGTGAIAYVSGTGQIKENLIVTSGQVRPGDTGGASVGTLNVTGNVTFNPTANITAGQFQLTTGNLSDKIAAAGSINLVANGDLSVIFQSYSTIVNGNSWTILQGTGGINYGTFSTGTDLRTGADAAANEGDLNLPDLTAISGYNGQLWQITNGANALVITIVPEPSAALLSGLGVVALGLRRRRK